MEAYLLKSSISLIVLYGVCRVMLHHEFNHQLNRMIRLSCVIFSMGFSFITLEKLSQAEHFPVTFYAFADSTADLAERFPAALSTNPYGIFMQVYWVGVFVLTVRFLWSLFKLLQLYLKSPKRSDHGFTVVTVAKDVMPFSFFSILFVGDNTLEDSEKDAIVFHERVHADQYHSLDSIFLEIVTIFFWFNPVAWFFKREIKAQHEYFADEQVLASGFNSLEYQLILFKTKTGVSPAIGNHLSSKNGLTKRFNMMTQTKLKSKKSYLKASLFLALMSVILIFSAFTQSTEAVDTVARYEQGDEAMYQSIRLRITYPPSARSENRTGLVKVSFTVNEQGNIENANTETKTGFMLSEVVVAGYSKTSEKPKGVNEVLKEECIRVVEGLGKFIPAQKNGKPVSSVLTLPVKFKIQE